MRKGIKTRINNKITNESSKDNDGDLLKELSSTLEYKLDEFSYVKEKLESKYGFKFKDYYKRSQTVEEWNKVKDTLMVVKKPAPIQPIKIRKIKDDDWSKTSASELSPKEALARFQRLKAEERKQQLLEEVRNVGLLIC
jgi:ribosomal protein L11 methylase PrmA